MTSTSYHIIILLIYVYVCVYIFPFTAPMHLFIYYGYPPLFLAFLSSFDSHFRYQNKNQQFTSHHSHRKSIWLQETITHVVFPDKSNSSDLVRFMTSNWKGQHKFFSFGNYSIHTFNLDLTCEGLFVTLSWGKGTP